MRHRSGFTRVLAAIFAVWFAVTLGDTGMLHACPMHGGAHVAHAQPPQAHAPHAHAGHAHDAPASHAPQPAHSGPCTCVGQCCAAASVLPLPVLATLVVPTSVAQPSAPHLAPRLDAPAAPDLRLPLANGPPLA